MLIYNYIISNYKSTRNVDIYPDAFVEFFLGEGIIKFCTVYNIMERSWLIAEVTKHNA